MDVNGYFFTTGAALKLPCATRCLLNFDFWQHGTLACKNATVKMHTLQSLDTGRTNSKLEDPGTCVDSKYGNLSPSLFEL